jgi:hypothetical protein
MELRTRGRVREGATSKTMICWRCEEDKSESDFYSDRGGFRADCKRCVCRLLTLTPLERAKEIARHKERNVKHFERYLASPAAFTFPGQWPQGEQWRPIPNYEGYYEASDRGRIRSLWFTNGKISRWRLVPLVLLPFTNDDGYQSLSLVKEKKTTEHVHRLVLLAFKGQPPEGKIGGHRDGDPSNNQLTNLDWITYEENEADKKRHGRTLEGSRNHQAKLNEKSVVQMRKIHGRGNVSGAALASQFGVSTATASKILRREAWRHVA